VGERQTLEKRARDQKIGSRALETLKSKHEAFDTKQTELFRDYETWKQESAEVHRPSYLRTFSLTLVLQAEEKVATLKTELRMVKQNLEKNEAERTKISYAVSPQLSTHVLIISQKTRRRSQRKTTEHPQPAAPS
jgi:hypothetical protein